jgi:hypothetical protein
MTNDAIERFIDALVAQVEIDETRLDKIKALNSEAFNKVAAGGGAMAFISATTGNGRSVTREQSITCDEMLHATTEALKVIANGRPSNCTTADMSHLYFR